MSSPKLERILRAVAGRLEVIAQADGYYSDIGARVFLDRRPPRDQDLPCVLAYLGERTVDETGNRRARAAQTVTVAAFVRDDGCGTESVAIGLLADIQRAVEIEDFGLGGLLLSSQYGLTWQSDQILTPEPGENVVGAEVVYSIPHVRKSGDPEIA